MAKNNIDDNAILRLAIEQWPVRIRKAGKRHLDLALAVGTSEGHLSQIISMKIKSPRITTTNKIEEVLEIWGV